MLYGLGFDLVEMARFERAVTGNDERFINKLLTPTELEHYDRFSDPKRRIEWLSGRFAAKEALFKALGTGFGSASDFINVEVVPDCTGRPIMSLSSFLEKKIGKPYTIHVTITHTKTTAGAVVMIEV